MFYLLTLEMDLKMTAMPLPQPSVFQCFQVSLLCNGGSSMQHSFEDPALYKFYMIDNEFLSRRV